MLSESLTQPGIVSREGRTWLLLSLVLVAGAYLRLHMLGVRSLWASECFSVLVAWQPWRVFLSTMWWGEANMAFYYLLLRGWLHLGDSEVWLQSLSVLFGVLTIPAAYALGSRFLSRKTGLVAAALLAVHSFHIEHSEQLRSYSLLTLLVVLSTYIFLNVLNSPDRKGLLVLYVLVSALAVYAQTFAVFVLCGHLLALKPERIKRLGVPKLLSTGAAIGVLSAPLMAVMLFHNSGQLDWVPRPSFSGILDVLRGIAGADALAWRSSVGSLVLLTLYVAAWAFAVWSPFPIGSEEPMAVATVSVLALWLVFPVVAMTAISFVKPILYPRYVLMCVPAAVLLTAQGVVAIGRFVPRGRLVASVLFLALMVLSLASTYMFDASLKNSGLDWRSVTKYILSRRDGGDAVLFYSYSGSWAWEYYVERERKAGDHEPLPALVNPVTYDRTSIEDCTMPYRRVWLVLHQELSTPQTDAKTALLVGTMPEHFHLVEEKVFGAASISSSEDTSIRIALYSAAAPMK